MGHLEPAPSPSRPHSGPWSCGSLPQESRACFSDPCGPLPQAYLLKEGWTVAAMDSVYLWWARGLTRCSRQGDGGVGWISDLWCLHGCAWSPCKHAVLLGVAWDLGPALLDYHIPLWNQRETKGSENSKFKPGLPGCIKVFVRVGGKNIFYLLVCDFDFCL